MALFLKKIRGFGAGSRKSAILRHFPVPLSSSLPHCAPSSWQKKAPQPALLKRPAPYSSSNGMSSCLGSLNFIALSRVTTSSSFSFKLL